MNINKEKWVSRAVLFFTVATLIWWAIYHSDNFSKYSGLLTTLTTLMFIFLTYETIRQMRQSEVSPYINIKFILSSKLDESFITKYSELVRSEQVQNLVTDFQKEDPTKKNLVFVQVENIGGIPAIDVEMSLDYNMHFFQQDSGRQIKKNFGTLKPGECRMELVDCFDVPSNNDFFEVNDCKVFFNTISRKQHADGPKKNDVNQVIVSQNHDANVIVVFQKK